ncbi:GNAT family N-acetyltransferase [Polaribacter sp. R77954]|uniref:GNAT family N-acetyltransferase n=1 Tax=Polaribacter sp. R77954 TaxID=3093870 RepID=UPI0037C9A4F1
MIQVSKNIQLQEISISDDEILLQLMKDIYPVAYHHFWKDAGQWYITTQYAKENIEKELSQHNANYYFILYNDKIVGNFRVIWDEKLDGLEGKKQVKLHRIYLHQKIQGKGVGKTLLLWLEKTAKEKGYSIIWLDAMDEQPQAFQFYKKLGYRYHSHCFLPFELLHNQVRKMSQVYKKLP